MLNSNSSLPNEWKKVREYVGIARGWLEAPDAMAPRTGTTSWCHEALVHLARAIYVPEFNSALVGTVPIKHDSPRVLDEYLCLKLHDAESTRGLRVARKLLDNATSSRNSFISSHDEAVICVEATIALVNIIADLEGINRDLITSAS